MSVYSQPSGYTISGMIAARTGSAIDTHNGTNYGLLWYSTQHQSAVFSFQGSIDNTNWVTHSTYTATVGTAQAQIAAYFPYVRASAVSIASVSAWGTSATGILNVYYIAGVK